MSFESPWATYGLSKKQFFYYARLRQAWRAEGLLGEGILEYAPLESRLLTEQLNIKAISMVYRTINNKMPDTLCRLRSRWEADLAEMKDEDWEAALMFPQEVAIRSRLQIIQFKILHRVYYDRQRLHTMGREQHPNCIRCQGHIGTFLHTIWGCPVIQEYWLKIVGELQGVVSECITLDPKFILLGIPNDVDVTQAKLIFFIFGGG
ncbi:hypothetical protein NDU88_002345 [Pleurodeles waltl]|uniref:Reverse transcriptase n=1 Tax=Pleurodeles waltl TaxID=8319 RepID=A0AAV7SCG7_PLEWA|nr:hypothetical protein NDU88_002345 [Pleurodeles waltl]